MQNKLPQIIIQGVLFEVDFEKSHFVKAIGPKYCFPFSLMQTNEDYYEFSFDPDKNHLHPLNDDDVLVRIPKDYLTETALFNKDIAAKANEFSYQYDYGMYLLMDVRIQQRLMGVLPKIDIAGHNYIIDGRLQELRLQGDQSSIINLKRLPVSGDGKKYLAFFHLPSRQVVNVNNTITELPREVVMLEIPNAIYLDPVGVARHYGLEDTALLRNHPIRDNLKATVKPLNETELPELVQKNLQKHSQKGFLKSFRKGKGRRI